MKKLKETIEIKLSKVCLWAKHHFWDVTSKFEDDIDADVCLDWARYCLLMATKVYRKRTWYPFWV